MRVRGGAKCQVAKKKKRKEKSRKKDRLFRLAINPLGLLEPSLVQVCILNPCELCSHIAASECDVSRLVVYRYIDIYIYTEDAHGMSPMGFMYSLRMYL